MNTFARSSNIPSLTLALAATTLIGCSTQGSGDGPGGENPGTYALAADILGKEVRNIDLLFVIDNSDSMAEEQGSMAERAREALFDVLPLTGNALPNLHIGVISTDLGANDNIVNCTDLPGDDGSFQNGPSGRIPCGIADGFLIDVDDGAGGRTTNYEGTLDETFSCMVKLGTGGCGFEQPLEAMRRALDGSNPGTDGFLREDALLAVVIVSDEDDCSAFDYGLFSTDVNDPNSALGAMSSFRCFDFGVTCDQANREPGEKTGCQPNEDSQYMNGVTEYVDFLRGLKSDPAMVVVAGIFGNADSVVVGTNTDFLGQTRPVLEPACVSDTGTAVPGVRLGAFLDGFPARNLFASICGDMQGPLTQTAKRIADAATQSPCLYGPLADTSTDTPGIQAACRVRVEPAAEGGAWTELPLCSSQDGDAACYTVVEASAECSHTETQLAVDLSRAQAVVEGKRVQVECLTP